MNASDALPLALAALVIEAAFGYPRGLYARIGHPVTWLGALIAALDRALNRDGDHPMRRRAAGIAALATLLAVTLFAALLLVWLASPLGPVALLPLALLASSLIAQRSLHEHVARVADGLETGGLDAGRAAVSLIVGRDPDRLDEAGVARAAIESLAENFSDGVVAPAFWLGLAGLPGIALYKAINTADSMIGHRDDRYRWFGWAAARSDDVVNWVPARLSGLMIAAAGGGGFRTMVRDARHHASPNGGWPEAAMAGALGRRLGGPVRYDGEAAARAWLGDGAMPEAADLARALWIYRRACLLLWVMVGGVAWLR